MVNTESKLTLFHATLPCTCLCSLCVAFKRGEQAPRRITYTTRRSLRKTYFGCSVSRTLIWRKAFVETDDVFYPPPASSYHPRTSISTGEAPLGMSKLETAGGAGHVNFIDDAEVRWKMSSGFKKTAHEVGRRLCRNFTPREENANRPASL